MLCVLRAVLRRQWVLRKCLSSNESPAGSIPLLPNLGHSIGRPDGQLVEATSRVYLLGPESSGWPSVCHYHPQVQKLLLIYLICKILLLKSNFRIM